MKIRYLFIIIFSCLICFCADAQIIDEATIKKELAKQGVSEEEVTKRLIERGFDPSNIDVNDPKQLLELKNESDSIIKEIKEEQLARAKSDAVLKEVTKTEGEALKEDLGKVEEVIVQEIKETNNPPVGNGSKLYGHHLFENNSINFYTKNQYVKPPPNYILGPGDKITIAIWGNAEANFNEEVTSEGYLKFNQIPRVYVAGLSLKDAKEALKSKFSRNFNFNGSSFEMTLSATRNVNIFLTGETVNIGNYNISALNTAINALAAGGGPTNIGSVRNIQLIKANGKKVQIDLYKFINDPIISQNFYLEDNDYIAVPVANKVVSISGAINRAYRYELLANETLQDLLTFAGGLKTNALKKNIKIKRFENDQLVILNVDMTDSKTSANFKLRNGDKIEVSTINERLRNVVSVSGALDNSGEFSIEKGMRLSNLFNKIILRDDAILDLAYLIRLNEDNKTSKYEIINIENALNSVGSDADLLLKEGDKLIIRGQADYTTNYTFEVAGSVRNPDIFDLDGESEIKISDAINLAGGLKPSATSFGYIIRKKPGEITPEYIPVDIQNAVKNPVSDSNISLSPGDKLRIYEKSLYSDETFVSIEGAVRDPKRFEYSESLTLKDAILQAGGLKLEAASNNIDIFRIDFLNENNTRVLIANASVDKDLNITSGGDLKLKPFDQIIVRTAAEFELQRAVVLTGELKYPGKYVLVDDNSTLVDLITEAGGLTEESFADGATLMRTENDIGYIVVNLEEAMRKPNSSINMILQKGDVLNIPKQNNLVTVTGAVNRQLAFIDDIANSGKSNFVYESGKSAKDYIQESGGFAENANKGSTSVVYPNGEIHKTKKFLFFKNYPKVVPGSTITVATKKAKVVKVGSEKEDIDWGKVIANSIAQATGVLSLILLIQNID